ncbi:MAG: M23 family metallopeptidase [Candidatus Obscuribacterales bacterium]|nr:M23 family metallopeptidase [Candidatus Obscuribacterales bacterium]
MCELKHIDLKNWAVPNLIVCAVICSSPSQASQLNATHVKKAAAPLSSQQAASAVAELRHRNLALPLASFDIERAKDSYSELRNGQSHEALDMLAPRNTPVLAVEDGDIAKLFESKLGGATIYQYDPTHRYVYYYAHLEKYADNLKDGQKVKRGEVLGYVGTSGNAPKNTPHLHFSISLVDADKRWWQTAPINPYLVFKKY